MSNFLLLASTIALFFAMMAHSTTLPPAGRVYGVMLDAGSTGTRAQVFAFRVVDDGRLQLDSTKMFKSKKSLASLATGTAPSGSALFGPLLEQVKRAVPGIRRKKRTPIGLRATAGLRLVGAARAELALGKARIALKASGFLFQDEWVSVLEEEEEGTFAWTTVNFLMGNLQGGVGGKGFIGAMELGGGSMQIVHKAKEEVEGERTEVAGEGTEGEVSSVESKVEVLGERYRLRATSYLGLGLFDFTKKLYTVFDREGVLEEGNPCFRKGKYFENKLLRFGVPGSEERRMVNMTGDGDFERCVLSAEVVIGTYSKLYSMKGGLPANTVFYAFAYFYDRTVGLGLSGSPSKKQLVSKGKVLCEAHPDLNVKGDFDQACAEFSYIYALLKHFTKDFSTKDDITIRFQQYVDGHMLGWALGAMLETIEPVMKLQLGLDKESLILNF